MKKLCVIGDPVGHSKSPLIHNTMIQAFGLDFEYLCQPVAREELSSWLARAGEEGWVGFSATMPHKEALVPYMDELDEDAKLYGAVNTVCIKDGKFYGYNTDGGGFIRALTAQGIEFAGKSVALMGAGGAAKAVALKLYRAGVGRMTLCNRTREKAQALAAGAPGVMSTASFEQEDLRRAAAGCDLLINCTNLGMAGSPEFECLSFLEALPAGAVVCDLIYHPEETALLAKARALGHVGMNGLPLLIHQAILALELFTGQALDRERAAALVEQVLKT